MAALLPTTFRQPVDAIVDKTVSLITQQLSDASLPPSFNALSGELIIRRWEGKPWKRSAGLASPR